MGKNNWINKLITLILFGLIVTLFSLKINSDFNGFFILLLVSIVIIFLGAKTNNEKLFFVILFALVLRLILAIFQVYIGNLPDSTADAVDFERASWQIANNLINFKSTASSLVLLFLKSDGTIRYEILISFLYFLALRAPLALAGLNLLFNYLTIFIVYFTALEIFQNKKIALTSAIITAIFPTIVLYSVITLRESLIMCFFSFSFLMLVKFIKKGNFNFFILSILSLIGAILFHTGLVTILPLYILCLLFKKTKIPIQKIEKYTIFIILILIIISIYPFISQKIFIIKTSLSRLPGTLSKYVTVASRGRANYLSNITPKSFFDLIWQTPIRIIYFLFAPFPWQITSKIDLIAFFDGLLYFILIISSIFGIKKIWSENTKIGLFSILILLMFLITFGWGVSNYGTAIRHRSKIAWLLIIIASPVIYSFFTIINKKLFKNYVHQNS
jgi:hypothetical protein